MFDYKDILLKGNMIYLDKIKKKEEKIQAKLKIPKYPVIFLTCMDPRIDIYRIFQLDPEDVFILRNAGNIFTEDMLRSILIAVHEYQVKFVIILGHLDCGMTKLSLKKFQVKLNKSTLKHVVANHSNVYLGLQRYFRNFADEVKNLENQIIWFRDSNFLPNDVKIKGMLYDSSSGWVFDLDEIWKYGISNNLYENYKTLIKEKEKEYAINFPKEESILKVRSIENDLIEKNGFENNPESIYIKEETSKTPISNANTDLFDIKQSFSKFKLPKIYIPKISVNIPKISVNIPQVYKKKSTN